MSTKRQKHRDEIDQMSLEELEHYVESREDLGKYRYDYATGVLEDRKLEEAEAKAERRKKVAKNKSNKK